MKSFLLCFLAEFGDKTMLSTVTLATNLFRFTGLAWLDPGNGAIPQHSVFWANAFLQLHHSYFHLKKPNLAAYYQEVGWP